MFIPFSDFPSRCCFVVCFISFVPSEFSLDGSSDSLPSAPSTSADRQSDNTRSSWESDDEEDGSGVTASAIDESGSKPMEEATPPSHRSKQSSADLTHAIDTHNNTPHPHIDADTSDQTVGSGIMLLPSTSATAVDSDADIDLHDDSMPPEVKHRVFNAKKKQNYGGMGALLKRKPIQDEDEDE